MSSLGIVSNTNQVALTINNAPASMMIRELMQNALEASGQAPKPQIKVDAAKEMSRNEMAWLVTSGLAFALAKRADITFSQDEEDAMVSEAVLTTHADRLMTDEIISKLTVALKSAKSRLETAII